MRLKAMSSARSQSEGSTEGQEKRRVPFDLPCLITDIMPPAPKFAGLREEEQPMRSYILQAIGAEMRQCPCELRRTKNWPRCWRNCTERRLCFLRGQHSRPSERKSRSQNAGVDVWSEL